MFSCILNASSLYPLLLGCNSTCITPSTHPFVLLSHAKLFKGTGVSFPTQYPQSTVSKYRREILERASLFHSNGNLLYTCVHHMRIHNFSSKINNGIMISSRAQTQRPFSSSRTRNQPRSPRSVLQLLWRAPKYDIRIQLHAQASHFMEALASHRK